MCGITIYKGIPTKITDIWNSMLQIKHRGDEEGFGYVDFTNKNDILKSLLTFDEIKNGELDETRKLKKDTKLRLIKRLKEVKRGLLKPTEFIILHNRKASCGEVSIENTHPIKITDKVYYVHNGSVDADLTKKYLTLIDGVKFNTKTDSEFLGWFVEKELSEGKKPIEVFNKLCKLCPYGFGVLIRIDLTNKELTIFKDTDRTLYLYNHSQSFLLISEPIETIKQFEECYRLNSGVITIGATVNLDLCRVTDITNRLNFALSKEGYDYSCDLCKSKGKTRRLYSSKDYCLVCATSDLDLEKMDKALNTPTTTSVTKKYTPAGNEIYDVNYWTKQPTWEQRVKQGTTNKNDYHDGYKDGYNKFSEEDFEDEYGFVSMR